MEGNPINKRNAWQARSTLYVRLIPPGAADVAHYRVRIPPDARGPITLNARLNYRKFAHYYTQFAYAGAWKKCEPLWNMVVRAHLVGSFRPLLERVLAGRDRRTVPEPELIAADPRSLDG